MKKVDNLIIGGGLTGLFLAKRLTHTKPEESTLLIEGSGEVGGLMKTRKYDEGYWFDFGPHLTGETNSSYVNDSIMNLDIEGGWNILADELRDLPGIYFEGSFSAQSTYPDIRGVDRDLLEKYLGQIILAANKNGVRPMSDFTTAKEYLEHKFGEEVTEFLGQSVLRQFSPNREGFDDLHISACIYMPVDRLVMFDEEMSLEVLNTPSLANRNGFIDQRDLPLKYSSGKRNFYPIQGGAYRVAEAFQKEIGERGGEIMLSSMLVELKYNAGVENKHQAVLASGEVIEFNKMFCAASPIILGKILGITPDYSTMSAPKTVAFANLVLEGKNNLDDLHYSWFGDSDLKSYRVTNYASFVEDNMLTESQFKLTVEMHYEANEEVPDNLAEVALNELKLTGMVCNEARLVFGAQEKMPHVFPVPTVNNNKEIQVFQEQLLSRCTDTQLFGFNSRPGLFFLRDVMDDIVERV